MAKTKRKRGRGPVRHPLCPSVMTELGALRGGPPSAGGLSPDGEGTARYRIWTCYGRRDRGNHTTGMLEIARRPDGEAQKLSIRQELKNTQGKLHTMKAKVAARRDELATPTAWTLSSGFSGSHMQGRPEMSVTAKGWLKGTTWTVRHADQEASRTVPSPITADWCLFEAVGRLPFDPATARRFAVLEYLSVLKADHQLLYRGKLPVTWGQARVELHRFDQFGRGVYPYEYWLDDDHRLLLVTTGPRTYILEGEEKGGRR